MLNWLNKKSSKKSLIYFFIFIFLIFAIYKLTPYNIKRTISVEIYDKLPLKYQAIAKILLRDDYDIRNLKNDYNVNFLPWTQFVELDLKKKFFEIDLKKADNYFDKKNAIQPFFLEIINDDVWVIDSVGKVSKINFNDITNNTTEKIKSSNIQSNLTKKIKITDTYVHNETIYFSFTEYKNSCGTLNIVFAKINNENLNFQNYYNSTECGQFIGGGRMQFFKHNNMDGLLLTTGIAVNDRPSEKSQDDNSIYGKVLFINSKTKEVINFSKGHRFPQGLYAEKNLILSTEHGPRGGDEINKIIFNKNYGWPISSYGETYVSLKKKNVLKKSNELDYNKSHNYYNFEEPIFSFVPSIGISEIIKLPNNFSNQWIDNFIVASLNARSLYRIKFDDNHNKIFFYEKIYIGQRIRDIKYHFKLGAILLALEDKAQLGILRKK